MESRFLPWRSCSSSLGPFFCGELKRTVPRVKVVQRITIDHTTRACIPSQPRGADGRQLPAPVTSRLSNKDKTKAFAALQERGCSATCEAKRPGPVREGSQEQWRALNAADSPRNWAASLDHLPPTSAANTTRRALPPAPCNSGYVRSFL